MFVKIIMHRVVKTNTFAFLGLFFLLNYSTNLFASPPKTSFVQVRLSVQNYSFANPWQNKYKIDTRTAIYLGNSQFLIHTPYPTSWIRSIRIFKEGLLELSATYLAHDDGLGLLVVQLDKEAMFLLKPSGLKPVRWAKKFNPLSTGKKIQIVSMRKEYSIRTFFFEKAMAMLTISRVARVPVLGISGRTDGFKTGDVVLYKKGVIGVLYAIDTKKEKGNVLAYPLIKSFLQNMVSKKQKISFQKWNKKKPDGLRTVIFSTRLKMNKLRSSVQKEYYGLKRSEGAVVVSDIDNNYTGRAGLRSGDLILKVNKQWVLSDGNIMDPGYGVVPLHLFFSFKKGQPRKKNAVLRLLIQRNKTRRTIKFQNKSLARRSLIIPKNLEKPAFYIFAGLLLHEISGKYINENPDLPAFVQNIYQKNVLNKATRKRRLVVLNRIFPLEINKGYQSKNMPILSIDGVVVENLQHAKGLLENSIVHKKQIVIGLHDKRLLVFDPALLNESNKKLQERYGIPFLSYGVND